VCEDLDVGKESIVLVYYKNLMCQRLMVSNLLVILVLKVYNRGK